MEIVCVPCLILKPLGKPTEAKCLVEGATFCIKHTALYYNGFAREPDYDAQMVKAIDVAHFIDWLKEKYKRVY